MNPSPVPPHPRPPARGSTASDSLRAAGSGRLPKSLGGLVAGWLTAHGLQTLAASGLQLRLESEGHSDLLVASNLAFRVEPFASPSPFLPPGPFTATWTGSITVDLRGDYRFRAEGAGAFDLWINGTNVLARSATNHASDWSAPVRLRKGANALRATLIRGNSDPAQVRLFWQGRSTLPGPLPAGALASTPDPEELATAERRRRGRGLVLRHRCVKCHSLPETGGVPDLDQDAPDFAGMGGRLTADWMARWIAGPRTVRPDATMPRLVHGPAAADEARAMATWLASLPSPASGPRPPGDPIQGRQLSETLHCVACHAGPGQPADAARIDLSEVGRKFVPGALARFLERPDAHYRWSRMPDFRLTAGEASHLAAWLGADSDHQPVTDPTALPDSDLIERGRRLVQTRGCLNCHAAPLENRFTTKPMSVVAARWAGGCLDPATGPTAREGLPVYDFTTAEREDLRALGSAGLASLSRHAPAEFAERWTRELRCDACHQGVDGIPRLDWAGDKLRPEWFARFVAGEVDYRPRPWLGARMPAFRAVAAGLAEGHAALHANAPRSPVEPAIDAIAAEGGRRLVSASGGFACVTCHAVGPFGATAVFEAPGINLVHSGERLLPTYFFRWLQNPQDLDPSTKMPRYFDDEGNSALSDFEGGDGPKTIHALWNYVRQGPAMTPPSP